MPDRLSPAALRVVVVLVVFLVLGAVCGWIWHGLWEAPTGVVFEDQWYLNPSGPDVGFSGTATYVLVAAVAGLFAGLGLALLRGHETLTLVTVVVGSVLAGLLMYGVGHALGPADPRPLAQGREDFAKLPSDLHLAAPDESRRPLRSTAMAAFPSGALSGLVAVYLVGRRRQGAHERTSRLEAGSDGPPRG